MITKLKLKNFQKHKDLTIELDKGVNAIVGQSDAGKSAVIRALNHALMNPTGDYTTHGEDEFRVGVWLDGKTIVRTKSKSENSYRLDKELYESIGKTIPKGIAEHINLSTINFQNQFDAPYMLADSAGACAREINAMSRLDMIDSLTQHFSKECRDNNKRLIDSCTELDVVKKKKSIVDKWSELPSVEGISERWKAIEKDKAKLDAIKKAANAWRSISKKPVPATETLTDALESIKSVMVGIDTLDNQYALALKYEQAKKRLAKVSLPLDISQIGAILESINANGKKLSSIRKTQCAIIAAYAQLSEKKAELLTFQNELDAVKQCPLCGGQFGWVLCEL